MSILVEIKSGPWWSLMPPKIVVTKNGREIAQFCDLATAMIYRTVVEQLEKRGEIFKDVGQICEEILDMPSKAEKP